MSNHATIRFDERNEAIISDMTPALLANGFRPLNEASHDDLTPGSVVAIYNSKIYRVKFCVIIKYYDNIICFNYINSPDDTYFWDKEFNNYKDEFYKILFKLPMVDSKPQFENFISVLKSSDFIPLRNATPDDVPERTIAFLYNQKEHHMMPIIIRVLSMDNHRLLNIIPSTVVAGEWDNNVIMDHLDSFDNYLIKVIS